MNGLLGNFYMTDREEGFYNLFYLFTMCHVRECDMKFMLWKFHNGLTVRAMAKLTDISYEGCAQHIRRGVKQARESIRGQEVINALKTKGRDFYSHPKSIKNNNY